MLLASHFDMIPLSEAINDGIRKYVRRGEIESFQPFTENMGLFDYETTLMFANLSDTWIVITLLVVVYLILWPLSKITKSFP